MRKVSKSSITVCILFRFCIKVSSPQEPYKRSIFTKSKADRQSLRKKILQRISVMKTNNGVFVVFKTKHELKCQFSGNTSPLLRFKGAKGRSQPPQFLTDQLTQLLLGAGISPPHYFCPLSVFIDLPTFLRLSSIHIKS